MRYETFSFGLMEEEYVCISVCTNSVTHWQLLLLLAVLNLDQVSCLWTNAKKACHLILYTTQHSY